MRKKIILLGSTGSIGLNTLDVIKHYSDSFEIRALSCGSQIDILAAQCREFGVQMAAVAGNVKKPADFPARLFSGKESIKNLILESGADLVVNAIAGSPGLLPSLWALEMGMDLALANKETIVMAGDYILNKAKDLGKSIIPVDSEHSAVFHLLHNVDRGLVDEILLTASGGAFRDFTLEEMTKVTPEQALKHPTWSMGKKITIDSASMGNKGLEIIEARYLFDLPVEKIKVVIHPQSLVHSMIRLCDGELYAQISHPDMRLPILSALFYPAKVKNNLGRLDFGSVEMSFYPPDFDKYPMLGLAYTSAEAGGGYTICYNAVNEIAVDAFIHGRISFMDIPKLVRKALDKPWKKSVNSITEILEIDRNARETAEKWIRNL